MVFLRLWDPDGRVEIGADPPTMPTFPTSTKPFSSITLLSSPVLTSSSELLVPFFLELSGPASVLQAWPGQSSPHIHFATFQGS